MLPVAAMTLVTGDVNVALLAVGPAAVTVDALGGGAHIEYCHAGLAAEVLWVPGLIQSSDTFLVQSLSLRNISLSSYAQDESTASCTSGHEPFLVINFAEQ